MTLISKSIRAMWALAVGILLVAGVRSEDYVPYGASSIEVNQEGCACVPYYQCTPNRTILTTGEGLLDIRIGSGQKVTKSKSAQIDAINHSSKCDHYIKICCIPPKANADDVKAPTEGSITLGESAQFEGGAIMPQHVSKGCGYRNKEGIGFRITGNKDNEAQFAEFPWMVAVIARREVNGKTDEVYICGGSLLDKRFVLTAAHCVEKYNQVPEKLIIRAGEWDTQTRLEPVLHQDRNVSMISIHPLYRAGPFTNDFAVLILEQPVEITHNVETICLPEAFEEFDNTRCIATGWGKSNFGDKGRYQVILKKVELPVVRKPVCQSLLRKTRLGSFFVLDKSFMCAGGELGVDVCTGDGGGPLVCPLKNDPNYYAQAGIVAWGIGCGQVNVPGVYADVAQARPWIDSLAKVHNIQSDSYTPDPRIRPSSQPTAFNG